MEDGHHDDMVQRFKTPRGDLYTLVETKKKDKKILEPTEEDSSIIYIENIDYVKIDHDELLFPAEKQTINAPEEIYATALNNEDTEKQEEIETDYCMLKRNVTENDDEDFYARVEDIIFSNPEEDVVNDIPQLPPRPSEQIEINKVKQQNIIVSNLKKIQNKATDKYHDIASSNTVKKCVNSVKTERDLVKNWFSNKYDKYHVKYQSQLENVKVVKANHQYGKITVNGTKLRFEDRVTMPVIPKTKHRNQTSFKKKAKTLPSRGVESHKNYDISEKDDEVKMFKNFNMNNDATLLLLTDEKLKDLRQKLKKTNIDICN